MSRSLRDVYTTDSINSGGGGLMIIYMIVLLPFLSISGFTRLIGPEVNQAYQSVAFLILVGLVILKARHLRLDKFTLLYIGYQLWILLVTTKNSSFNLGLWVVVFSGVFVVMLLQVDMEAIIRALTWLTVAAIIVNLGYMVRYGASEQIDYFVGGKNSFSVFMIPAAFLLINNALLRRNSLSIGAYLFIALIAFCITWGGSSTGMITVGTLVAGMIWIRRKNPNMKALLWIILIFSTILVFFSGVLTNSSLWRTLTDLLGKDASLTSRTVIWKKVLQMLKGEWLMGLGRGPRIAFVNQWGARRVVSEAHNFLLEILLNGGIVGLVLYVLFFREAIRNLDMRYLRHRMVYLAILVLMINGLTESVTNKIVINVFIGMAYATAMHTPVEKPSAQDDQGPPAAACGG